MNLTYEVNGNGYTILMDGQPWIVQEEFIPFPAETLEKSAQLHIKDLLDGINGNSDTLESIKATQIAKSKDNLESYLAAHPITSSCHGGAEKQYTITKDKQALLTQEIAIAQMAVQAGVEYQPSWNATGESCTYDWTLTELQQLAFEAVAIVKPLVSHQQSMEAQINAASTKEDALAVSIEF